jgi:hypothetical protein
LDESLGQGAFKAELLLKEAVFDVYHKQFKFGLKVRMMLLFYKVKDKISELRCRSQIFEEVAWVQSEIMVCV